MFINKDVRERVMTTLDSLQEIRISSSFSPKNKSDIRRAKKQIDALFSPYVEAAVKEFPKAKPALIALSRLFQGMLDPLLSETEFDAHVDNVSTARSGLSSIEEGYLSKTLDAASHGCQDTFKSVAVDDASLACVMVKVFLQRFKKMIDHHQKRIDDAIEKSPYLQEDLPIVHQIRRLPRKPKPPGI